MQKPANDCIYREKNYAEVFLTSVHLTTEWDVTEKQATEFLTQNESWISQAMIDAGLDCVRSLAQAQGFSRYDDAG